MPFAGSDMGVRTSRSCLFGQLKADNSLHVLMTSLVPIYEPLIILLS